MLIERVVKARARSRIPGGDASKVGPVASAVAEAVDSIRDRWIRGRGFRDKTSDSDRIKGSRQAYKLPDKPVWHITGI